MLSNFSETPFVLDGKRYASVEAFWQAIKFEEGSFARAMVAELPAKQAKKANELVGPVSEVTYQGEVLRVGTLAHYDLMARALRAKFDQNPAVRNILLQTGDAELTHDLRRSDGTQIPDSLTLPAAIFTSQLTDLRGNYRERRARRVLPDS